MIVFGYVVELPKWSQDREDLQCRVRVAKLFKVASSHVHDGRGKVAARSAVLHDQAQQAGVELIAPHPDVALQGGGEVGVAEAEVDEGGHKLHQPFLRDLVDVEEEPVGEVRHHADLQRVELDQAGQAGHHVLRLHLPPHLVQLSAQHLQQVLVRGWQPGEHAGDVVLLHVMVVVSDVHPNALDQIFVTSL